MQLQVAVLVGQSVVLIAQLFRDIQKTLILHSSGVRDYREAVGITTRAVDLVPDSFQQLFVGCPELRLVVRRCELVLVLSRHVDWHVVIDHHHLALVEVRHASPLRSPGENDSRMR